MYPNFYKLKNSSWWSSDTKLSVEFTELKGLPAVKITEFNSYPRKSRIYILRSTESDKIVFFDTRKGPVTIGIINDGDELYLSPMGVRLYSYDEARNLRSQTPEINSDDEPISIIVD